MESSTIESSEESLRDWLAVERTKLANQRTLLAMLRTGLYFLVMGLTIVSLDQLESIQPYYWVFFLVGAIFIGFGIFYFLKVNKPIINKYKRTF